MSKNIEPTRERIREIAKILMDPKNKVARRLKEYQLYDWHDPKDQRRYQPFDVAAIVALAERDMKIYKKVVKDHKKARDNKENQELKRKRKIKEIERITKQNFNIHPEKLNQAISALKNRDSKA